MGKGHEKTALIIGGGPAGLEAAIKIGRAGHRAILVEKDAALGGTIRNLFSSFPRWENPQQYLALKISELEQIPLLDVYTNTEVISSHRHDNGYKVLLNNNSTEREEYVEAVVIATGFEIFDASVYSEYGYGNFENVLNSLEFENTLKAWAGGEADNPPETVAFFKCVGSRDRSKGYPYCSKICCMYTAKQAGLVKDIFPSSKCYVFYMDYRASGKEYEEFVRSVIEQKHVRYVRGRPAKVLPENGRLLVRAEDTLMGIPVEITADMIVLATAIVPGRGTRKMAELFGVNTDQYGFIDYEENNPVKAGERIYFAGACGFPVERLGAQQQGLAAAAEVIALFNSQEGK